MKPTVPNLLAKFYTKHDPAIYLHEIKTTDLPDVGTLYRDNTTGIVWKILAHSGGDNSIQDFGAYGYGEITSLRKSDHEPERLLILQSVEPEGATMHVSPCTLTARIHSMDHYKMVMKATPDIERFTKLDRLGNNTVPFWKREVYPLNTDETLRSLARESTTSLFVINVYATKHGLVDLLVEYLDENSVNRSPQVAKIAATWLPQDLLESVPKAALLKSQTFRRFLDNGFIKVITANSAKRVFETEEGRAEIERQSHVNPKMMYPN
jgi:hypothetical protein